MLSDDEREALRELERQFAVDPDVAPSLPSQQVKHKQFGASGTLLIGTIVFFGVLMLMAGSLTGAVMFGAAAWLIWWAWLPTTEDPPR